MPTISWFYGIAIRMYYNDHAPPHFHAIYQGDEALYDIQSGKIVAGKLPKSADRLIKEWILGKRPELLANWEHARQYEELEKISGLDAD